MLEPSIKAVKKAILMFVEAESWAECKQIVEARRELLLTEMADQVLTAWIQQSQGNVQATRVFQEYRQLLMRCRQEGIETAFADRVRPSQEVYNAVLALVQAENWVECKQLVEREAKLLLSESVNQVLISWLKQSQQDPHAMRVFNEYRELLLRCREVGIEAAFAARVRPSEAVFEAVRQLIETKDEAIANALLVEKRQLLLSSAADQVFVLWLKQAEDNAHTTARLKTYRAWLARQRAEAEASAVTHSPQALSQAVQAFVAAKSWAESKQIVEAQQALLLSDMADQVLIILLKQAEDEPAAVRLLQKHRDLLDHCRREGIDAAFAAIQSPTDALSSVIQAFIHASSWSESQKIVKVERDLLLSEEADQFLADLLAQHQGNQKMLRVIQEHRQLLRRCRTEGIENAFTQPLQPLQTLSETLLRFVDATEQSERKRLVKQHQAVLLSQTADNLFAVLIKQAKNDPARVKALRHDRQLLVNCRTNGIEQAFSEPVVLPDVSQELQARLMAVQSQEEFDKLVTAHPELLSILEEIDPMAENITNTDESEGSPSLPNEELAKTLFTFVAAQSWPESKAYLENHPELLSTEADRMLGELLAQHSSNEQERHALEEHRELLAYARRKGIQAAFANLAPAPRHVIPSVRRYLNAQSMEEQQAIIEAERDLLLSDAADEVLANLQAGYSAKSKTYKMISKQRALLALARRKGIDVAFAEYHTLEQQTKDASGPPAPRHNNPSTPLKASVSRSNPPKQPKTKTINATQTSEVSETSEVFPRSAQLGASVSASNPPKQPKTTKAPDEQKQARQNTRLTDDWLLEMTPTNGIRPTNQVEERDDDLIFDEPSEQVPQKAVLQEIVSDNWQLEMTPNGTGPGHHVQQAHEDDTFDEPSGQNAQNAQNAQNEEVDDWLFHESSGQTGQNAGAADDWLFDDESNEGQSSDQAADEDTILETVLLFMEAKSWAESRRLVEQHRDILLTDEAEQMMRDLLAQYKSNVDITRLLAEHYDFLQRIRRDGIDAAFANRIRPANRTDIPPEFTGELQVATAARERLKSDNSEAALNAAVQAWQQLFNHPNISRYATFKADVQSELGSVLLRRYWVLEQASDLNAAIQAYQQVLELTPRNAAALPGRLNNLGLLLRARFALHRRPQDINAAIMAYQRALKLIAFDANERPSILNNLGVALTDRYNLEANPNDLNAAILTYEDALKRLPQHATNRHAIEENLKLALQDRFKDDQ